MAYECRTKVERPIRGVSLAGAATTAAAQQAIDTESVKQKHNAAQRDALNSAMMALDAGAEALVSMQEQLVRGQAQQIAHLAVEIARKILQARVEQNDYRIEAVVQEALNLAPAKHNVTVRLNPADVEAMESVRERDGNGALGAIEILADANIGRGECVIETPKGSVESIIEEHLAKVEEALKNSNQTN